VSVAKSSTNTTVIEFLACSLESAARFNPNDVVHPYAVLWTDHDAQWQPVIPQLRRLLPQLLTFGEFQPDKRIEGIGGHNRESGDTIPISSQKHSINWYYVP
jgi:hypothetical protein